MIDKKKEFWAFPDGSINYLGKQYDSIVDLLKEREEEVRYETTAKIIERLVLEIRLRKQKTQEVIQGGMLSHEHLADSRLVFWALNNIESWAQDKLRPALLKYLDKE